MDIEEARRRLAANPPQGDPTAEPGETLDEKAVRLLPFDGCSRHSCVKPGVHSLAWGECEHAPESDRPEPRISLFGPFRADDGEMSLGTTSFTIPEMADKVEAALRQVGIQLGPNALTMLGRGEPVALSGGEYGAMALAVATMLAEEGGK